MSEKKIIECKHVRECLCEDIYFYIYDHFKLFVITISNIKLEIG